MTGRKYVLIFMIGFAAAKMDSKYGYEFGFNLGRSVREVFIDTDPQQEWCMAKYREIQEYQKGTNNEKATR